MFQLIWAALASWQLYVGILVGIVVAAIVAKKNGWITIKKK